MAKKKGGTYPLPKCYICGGDFKPSGNHDLYCPKCRQEGNRRDREAVKNADDDSIIRLVIAIIKNANIEYEQAIKHLHKQYEAEKKRIAFDKVKELSRYYKSEDCYELCLGNDPTEMQKAIIKKTYESIRIKRRQKQRKARRKNGL